MTRDKKIPALRFPEFEGEWVSSVLNDIINDLDSGVSVNSENEKITSTNEFGILKTSCISLGYFYEEEYKKILPTEVSRARLNPMEDTILISRMNTPQLVGESGYIPKTYLNLFIPDRLWMAYINKEKMIVKFLSYVLITGHIKDAISNIATGTSGSMKNISKPNFLNLSILFPHKEEQKKIASFLTAVDDKIQQLTKKKTLLAQYKKGVMQQIFSQQIRFKDDNGNDYPDWEMLKAEKLFKNSSNKKHSGDLPILAITQGKGTVYREDLEMKIQSSEASIKSYKIVEVGDFIIRLRSFQGGIEYSSLNGICSPAYTILKPIKKIIGEFYKFYLKKESFIADLSSSVIGIRDGKQISYEVFSTMNIPFPSIQEQKKIANFLTTIDDKINAVTKQLEQTQQFKKGLLQQMFV